MAVEDKGKEDANDAEAKLSDDGTDFGASGEMGVVPPDEADSADNGSLNGKKLFINATQFSNEC